MIGEEHEEFFCLLFGLFEKKRMAHCSRPGIFSSYAGAAKQD
jgi:hypothetical protein